jgi:hypothetical protein
MPQCVSPLPAPRQAAGVTENVPIPELRNDGCERMSLVLPARESPATCPGRGDG